MNERIEVYLFSEGALRIPKTHISGFHTKVVGGDHSLYSVKETFHVLLYLYVELRRFVSDPVIMFTNTTPL